MVFGWFGKKSDDKAKAPKKPEAAALVAFRAAVAAPVGVRAVGQEQQDTRGPELREAVQVEELAVERCLVDLEVARVNSDARGRVDRHGQAVRHAVRDAQKLQP